MKALAAIIVVLLTCAVSPAAFMTYNFNAPNFVAQSTTPLLNVSPNIGDPAFNASFTAGPVANGIEISNTFIPNILLSGQILLVPTTPAEILTVTTNQPITSIGLVFATNGPSSLNFASGSGSTSVISTVVGGPFPGGALNFSSATPFSSFTITTSTGTQFAIDDLVLNTPDPAGVAAVPVPPTIFIAAFGILAVGIRRIRR